MSHKVAAVAQMVEHVIRNDGVGSSSLFSGTTIDIRSGLMSLRGLCGRPGSNCHVRGLGDVVAPKDAAQSDAVLFKNRSRCPVFSTASNPAAIQIALTECSHPVSATVDSPRTCMLGSKQDLSRIENLTFGQRPGRTNGGANNGRTPDEEFKSHRIGTLPVQCAGCGDGGRYDQNAGCGLCHIAHRV